MTGWKYLVGCVQTSVLQQHVCHGWNVHKIAWKVPFPRRAPVCPAYLVVMLLHTIFHILPAELTHSSRV